MRIVLVFEEAEKTIQKAKSQFVINLFILRRKSSWLALRRGTANTFYLDTELCGLVQQSSP